eukprot:tig00021234_g19435.t1
MCAIAEGNLEAARTLASNLRKLPQNNETPPEVARAIAAVDVADLAAAAGMDVGTVAGNAGNHEARYRLAVALFLTGSAEKAVETALELVKKGKGWNDQAAKKLLLKVFEALGASHPVSVAGRKRLSALLFV